MPQVVKVTASCRYTFGYQDEHTLDDIRVANVVTTATRRQL